MIKIFKIKEAYAEFKPIRFGLPLKLGKGSIEDITLATVNVTIEDKAWKIGKGTGQILLSDIWAQPGDLKLDDGLILTALDNPEEKHEILDSRMRRLLEASCNYSKNIWLENPFHHYSLLSGNILEEGIKLDLVPLARTVATAPLDYAIWNAYADLNKSGLYDMLNNLSFEIDSKKIEFRGLFNPPRNKIRVLHTLGGGDKIYNSEAEKPFTPDGIPATLESWVQKEGISAVKIKLMGDISWDLNRIEEVFGLMRNVPNFIYSVDANESYENMGQLEEFMGRLSKTPYFNALWFVEQPTKRDSDEKIPDNIKKYGKPIVADESLSYPDDAERVYRLGYTGIVFKPTARGLTTTLTNLVSAKNRKMLRTVQDLTNPNLALYHHFDFASRVVGENDPVEANARQYLKVEDRDPQYAHLYAVNNGVIRFDKVS